MSRAPVLVVGRDHAAIAKFVRHGAPSREIREVRSVSLTDATAEDFDGVEAVLAFTLPEVARGRLEGVAFVQSMGAGADGLLRFEGIPDTVAIARVTEVFGAPISDYVLARCLAIVQELPRLEAERRAGAWRPFFPRLLRDLRATVVGLGEIGREVALRLIANGVSVLGVNRSGAAVEGIPRVESVENLAAAAQQADLLILVIPHTSASERIVDAAVLAALPSHAWLINVARGAVVHERALVDALTEGRIAGAALDVFENEPLAPDSPLRALDNVMVSPHVAGVTTPRQAADALLENLARNGDGRPLLGLVDRRRGY